MVLRILVIVGLLRFRTGNLEQGLVFIVRCLLRPRLLSDFVIPIFIII